MPKFSRLCEARLSTCDPRLQDIFNEVIKWADCTVTCGFRDQEDQDEAFKTGKSKLQWPNSKHNSSPSKAVDVIPYPVDWKDLNRFYLFIGYVKGIAAGKGIQLRSGGDWDGDFDLKDQNFFDLPHFELIE